MRRLAALPLALLTAATLLAGDAARLVVEPDAFDFGEALPQRTLTKEFRLSNHGSAELRLEKISTSCGCTVVGDHATVIPPGGNVPLRVELSTRDDRGRVVRRVLIRSNDPGPQPREIRLEATVVEEEAAE